MNAVGICHDAAEPAPIMEMFPDGEDRQIVSLAWTEGEESKPGIAIDGQSQPLQARFEVPARGQDSTRARSIALDAEEVHHGPRRGNGAARPRSGHGWRRHRARGPVGGRERLVRVLLGGSMKNRRGPLGGVAVFVEIRRDRADALDPKIPGRERDAFELGEGVQIPAHTGVDV